jgi:hypothetical protein
MAGPGSQRRAIRCLAGMPEPIRERGRQMSVRPSGWKVVAAAAAGAAACVLAAAGCGTAGTSGTSGSGSTGAAQARSKIVLNVTLVHAPGQGRTRWTLRCDPPGGTDPDAAAACATLLRKKDPFAPQPGRHVNCPMIMVSDRQYVVTGTWYGSKVHAAIVDGGCDLSLFATMREILR